MKINKLILKKNLHLYLNSTIIRSLAHKLQSYNDLLHSILFN